MKYYSSIGIKGNIDHQDDQKSKKFTINGQRPSPLKISKDSHAIHKPSDHDHRHQIKSHQPVIIYTHSPKIIHTQPRDFMALVQRLTGPNRADDVDDDHISPTTETACRQSRISNSSLSDAKSDNDSSSISTDEIDCNASAAAGGGRDLNFSLSSNPNFFADFPLFTPNGTDHSSVVGSSSLSPTFLEFMKGLPEY